MSLVLGLETSCDETAAAVVEDGRKILSSVIASQVEIHRQYGGVFPEVASRQHVLDIVPVVRQALAQAMGTPLDGENLPWQALDALAVTSGPGLVGSLLVGVNVAKGIAWPTGLPLIGINHLEAHLYANWLFLPAGGPTCSDPPPPAPHFSLICLIVSGGHTDLVLMTDHGKYRLLGRTLDDAAGEAFDKVARLLGLGYPGGPAIQSAAEGGDPERFALPRAVLKDNYDFSFSGLKTAVLRIVQEEEGLGKRPTRRRAQPVGPRSDSAPTLPMPLLADLAASFQAAVVDVLVEKTRRAAEEFRVEEILLAGGVASNALLRQEMKTRNVVPVRYPPPVLCTDNAAMVAAAGYFKHVAKQRDGWALDVRPGLTLACE
jgi:N6-L-threonylcarbamoyladenine synthase